MRGHFIPVVAILLGLALGCAEKPDPELNPGASPTGSPTLSEVGLTEFDLPQPDVLTLATPEDIAKANSVSAEVRAAVNRYIKEHHRGVKWQVSALREVDTHLLLWLSFPGIMDGGVDIIYSKVKQAVVGTFLGGYRG